VRRSEAEEGGEGGGSDTTALEADDELVGLDWRCWNDITFGVLICWLAGAGTASTTLRCSDTAVGYRSPSENNKAIAPQIAAQSASDSSTTKIIDPPTHSRGPPRLPTGRMAVTHSERSSNRRSKRNPMEHSCPVLLLSVVDLAPRSAGQCVRVLRRRQQAGRRACLGTCYAMSSLRGRER
jgi:hypothetical protein